jgi:hypothetical protein
MEPNSKIKLKIQIIVLPLWFFKNTKLQFETMSTPLGGSYDYECTPRLTLNYLLKICRKTFKGSD